MTPFSVSDLLGLPRYKDPGRRTLLTRAHLNDFKNAIGAPACIPQREITPVDGVTFGLALDVLYAVDMRQAASDAASNSKEVDVGLPVDLGTPAWVPKLVGDASLLHVPSSRSRRTKDAPAARSCVARGARFGG
jgi:enoyl-CoA hydratase/carnithine racemase